MLHWNELEKTLDGLPQGAGQLKWTLKGHKLTGTEKEKVFLELTPETISLYNPTRQKASLKGLEQVKAEGPYVHLITKEGMSVLHTGIHTQQICHLLEGLLTDETEEEVTEEGLLHMAETGQAKAVEALVHWYQSHGQAEKARRWQSLLETKKECSNDMETEIKEQEPEIRPEEVKEIPEKEIHIPPTAEAEEREEEYREKGLEYQKEMEEKQPVVLSADDMMLQAQQYAQVEDRKNEYRALEHAAALSHPEAHFKLATYLASGMYGHQKDEKAAYHHMSEAADLGHKEAPYYLGIWNRDGFGTDKDLSQAERWLQEDASAKGKVQLALLYGDLLKDYKKAEETAQKALELSSVAKTKEILESKRKEWADARQQQEQVKAKELRKAHIFRDAQAWDLALESFQTAADAGSTEAKYWLAVQHLYGQGTQANPQLAGLLFEQVKDLQPEANYFLTYLETDEQKKVEYARKYLAQPADKERQEKVRTWLNTEEAKNCLKNREIQQLGEFFDELGMEETAPILAQWKGKDEEKELEQMAEAGNGDAYALLALMVLNEDPDKGAKLLNQALKHHSALARRWTAGQ